MISVQPLVHTGTAHEGGPTHVEMTELRAQGSRQLMVKAGMTTVLVTLAWTLYRATTSFPGWVDALLAKPLLWLGPVVLAVVLLERSSRSWFSLPAPRLNLGRLGRDIILGAAVAALLAAWVLRGHEPHPVSVYGVLVWPLATAVVEELVYRGYLMARLWAWCGEAWLANLLSAAAFALIHLPLLLLDQGFAPAAAFTTLRTIFVLGLGLGWLFEKTRGLAAPIAAHAVWNAAVTWFG